MIRAGKLEHVFVSEIDAVLPLPSTPPELSSFPISLTIGKTTNLALLNIPVHQSLNNALIQGVINWSTTFFPPVSTANVTVDTPGSATVSFEILVNGFVIDRLTQTVVQNSAPLIPPSTFSTASTSFAIATLLHLDHSFQLDCHLRNVYTLRATNITIVPPIVSSDTATATASVGAVTMLGYTLRPTKT